MLSYWRSDASEAVPRLRKALELQTNAPVRDDRWLPVIDQFFKEHFITDSDGDLEYENTTSSQTVITGLRRIHQYLSSEKFNFHFQGYKSEQEQTL